MWVERPYRGAHAFGRWVKEIEETHHKPPNKDVAYLNWC